jgi:hypothetical protein
MANGSRIHIRIALISAPVTLPQAVGQTIMRCDRGKQRRFWLDPDQGSRYRADLDGRIVAMRRRSGRV